MCNSSDIETQNHFISCDTYKDHWIRVYDAFKLELQSLLRKNAQDDSNPFLIDRLISLIIGSSVESTTFHIFKQWARKGKIMTYHSKLIRTKLRLSLMSGTRVDMLVLLSFLQLFKSMVWLPRCETQVKWEERHGID